VPEPKNLNSTTSSTLPQLLDIDSQLSFQEAQLLSQLESIQQKRQSLQVVISLFNEAEKALVAAPIEKEISTSQAQTVDESQAVVEPEPQESLTTSTPTPTPASTTVKKRTTPTNKKSQTKKTRSKKAAKPVVGWQQYLKEEFSNSSLPQAIAQVIHSNAKRVWNIASVTDAIFVEEIPVEVRKKVRLQITNLLAAGARENKWYRQEQGSYTLSGDA